MDELRMARLRWRFRGAWQWPLFFVLVPAEAVLLNELPVWGDGARGLVPGVLLAGFLNLAVVALGAPLLGRLVRRRRPDLPRGVAADYAGTGLLLALAAALVAGGLANRTAVADRERDRLAQYAAVHDYVVSQAPDYRAGLSGVDTLRLGPDLYRTCVPDPSGTRPLCLFVETDQQPAGVRRDREQVPNSAYRVPGGFD